MSARGAILEQTGTRCSRERGTRRARPCIRRGSGGISAIWSRWAEACSGSGPVPAEQPGTGPAGGRSDRARDRGDRGDRSRSGRGVGWSAALAACSRARPRRRPGPEHRLGLAPDATFGYCSPIRPWTGRSSERCIARHRPFAGRSTISSCFVLEARPNGRIAARPGARIDSPWILRRDARERLAGGLGPLPESGSCRRRTDRRGTWRR